MAGGDPAINPFRLDHHVTAACHLLGCEHLGNMHHHATGSTQAGASRPITTLPCRSATPAARRRHNVAPGILGIIILVGEVVDIELKGRLLVDLVAHHGVELPIIGTNAVLPALA
jgi:hypothetical protein